MENAEEKKCPKCRIAVLKARTKRSFWTKYMLFFLPLKRFRCTACGKKSYVFGTYSRKRVAWI